VQLKWFGLLVVATLGLAGLVARAADCPPALDYTLRTLNSAQSVSMCSAYRGKVILIVNTASKCAFTPQYEGLESLYERYKERGLVVLGFPSNDFANQEPGSEQQISRFCRLTYDVAFPMFGKTRVTASNADPLYRTLGELAGEYPQWNFHKYLLNRNGELIGSFGSHIKPGDQRIVQLIESNL
jgi:glutathione peroxidase